MAERSLFGVPDEPFGARGDLVAEFGVIPTVPDFRDENTKSEQDIEGALITGSSFWTPTHEPGFDRMRLSARSPYSPFTGDRASLYLSTFRQEDEPIPADDLGQAFGQFGFSPQLDTLKQNFTQWDVFGHTSAGKINRGAHAGLFLDSGVYDSDFSVNTNRPRMILTLEHNADDGPNTVRFAELDFFLLDDSLVSVDGLYVPCAKVVRTAAQTIVTATITAISFTAADEYDRLAMHDPGGADPSAINITKGGIWHIGANAVWSASPVNGLVYIELNGTEIPHTRSQIITDYRQMNTCADVILTAGDTIKIVVQQNSGSNKTVTGRAWLHFVSES